MEQHQALVVADRLAGSGVAGAEFGERKVAPAPHMIGILLQTAAAVLGTESALLLNQVIGQVTGQALGPVTAVIVDIDTVAPPVMENFMGVG